MSRHNADKAERFRAIVQDHLKVIEDGFYYVDEKKVTLVPTQATIENSESLSHLDIFNSKTYKSEIEVVNYDTVSAVIKYSEQGKIGVLNFASARTPGGSFLRGGNAQEEFICRKSNLYLTLLESEQYYKDNTSKPGGLATQNLIVSTNVSFIRDKDDNLLEKPIETCVITSPAVDNRHLIDGELEKIYHTMYERIENIVKVMIGEGVEAPIFGAFGCGVFKNTPTIVSLIFREILLDNDYKKYFKKVIFAIPTELNPEYYNKSAHNNFNVFYSQLNGK